jgi:DnaK suppressor protein
MNARDLERYKTVLLAKRDELSAPRSSTHVPPASDVEGDMMDQARAETEADFQARLQTSDTTLLKDIEDALARIRTGTFGTCAACKEPISKARLEAVPWTPLCRECKEREASSH